MGFMQGKRVLIVGLASNRSIAWGIAQAMHREGAELAFTFQNEKLQSRVQEMAAECNSSITVECDVGIDEHINNVFTELGRHWDGLDCIVHSVAFAPRDALEGDYVNATTRDNFRIAHDISSYSFTALAKAGRGMMAGRNGSLLTLTYLGAERAIPNYNVMGVAKASWKPTCAIWPWLWGLKAPGSTLFPQAPSARWPQPASIISNRCSARRPTPRR